MSIAPPANQPVSRGGMGTTYTKPVAKPTLTQLVKDLATERRKSHTLQMMLDELQLSLKSLRQRHSEWENRP